MFLIACGADVNSIDSYGKPVIVTAMLKTNSEKANWFVEMLIKNGADTNYVLRATNQTVKEFALSIENRSYTNLFVERIVE